MAAASLSHLTRDVNATPSGDESDRLHAAKIGLLLLSLDAVAARAEQLGFGFDQPGQVKAAARGCAAWWQNPRANSAGPFSALIAAFGDALEQMGDLADRAKVARWLDRFAFAVAAGSITDSWSVLLTRYNAAYASALRELGLGAESADVLRQVATEYSERARAIDALDETIQAAMTSPWDRTHYAEYQAQSELMSPTDYLWSWLQADAVLAALDVVLARFADDDLRIFSAWARVVAEVDAHVPPSRVSVDLVRPLVTEYKGLAHPHAS